VPEIVLVRHGQTEWSKTGQHTGVSDIPLTPDGEQEATRLRQLLAGRTFALTLSSPRQRARRTAELAGVDVEVDERLREWDYGGYEGMTTSQIREQLGTDWRIFRDGVVPGDTPGERLEEVAARTRGVLDRAQDALDDGGDVALFAHGHVLRILAATWLEQPPQLGAALVLSSGSVSVLGREHGVPAILAWNLT
jgi:broad specificity phosphatase PhoE